MSTISNRWLFFLFAVSIATYTISCTTEMIDETPIEEEVDYGNIDDLLPLSIGNTASEHTPMGRYYENKKETTAEDIAWLGDPANEPALPPEKTESLDMKPFSVELYPFGKPSPADCNQRALGNCSAIAVFAELAYINPDFITSIIKDNGDDTYTVKMYDPKAEEVLITVSNNFMSYKDGVNLAGVNGKKGQATWATIMEKALMKYMDIYKIVTNIEGIGSEFASPPFTGDGGSFAFSPSTLNSVDIRRAVEVSLAEGKIVIGGFNKKDVLVGSSKTVTGHAWSFSYAPDSTVNGYDPIFVMRNPWGNDNGTDKDGQIFIPAQEDVTNLIDLRIINAGVAKPSKVPDVYTPPLY